MSTQYLLKLCILIILVVEIRHTQGTGILPVHYIHGKKDVVAVPGEVRMYEGETQDYVMNCTVNSTVLLPDNKDFKVVSSDHMIGGLLCGNHTTAATLGIYHCVNSTTIIRVKGGHLGITSLNILPLDPLENASISSGLKRLSIQVKILRRITLFDELAVVILGPLVLLNKCAFGAKIELDVLKRVVTRPVELLLCLITQFVFMPLVAVFLGHICSLNQVMSLALLVSAACPGGGGGYVFSFLINGDITLAITASLVSTLVAMVAMPSVIGIYAAAAHIPNEIMIPYVYILLMLLAIATPISLGMCIRKKWPDFAKKLITIIRPLSLFLIAGGLVVVIVTSRYVLYGPKIGLLLAVLIPLSGFLIACFLSRCFSLDWPLTKAVSLESGLKNTFLGVAVIELSFPQPQADLASILIIMITVGQVVVSMIWYALYLIKSKLQKQKGKKKSPLFHTIDVEETELFLGE